MQVLADFARYKFQNFSILQKKKKKNFLKPFLKIKNDFDFAKKLSHKNAIKGHIFEDADFADFWKLKGRFLANWSWQHCFLLYN